MADQPPRQAGSPIAIGPGRPRSIASSPSSGSLRGLPSELASALASSSSGPTLVSASPPVPGRGTTISPAHLPFAHSGHGAHSAHIVRAKPAVRSSNPGWRASVCGPNASTTVAAASQGLDSPTLTREGQQQPQPSYVYGYAGAHHTPASPSLSTRTSLSSSSAAGQHAPAATAGAAYTAHASSGPSTAGATAGSSQPQKVHTASGSVSEMSTAAKSGQSQHGSGGESDHQYSNLSGTSRQNIAMAAFRWNSIPVTASSSGTGSGSGGIAMSGSNASRDGSGSQAGGAAAAALDPRYTLAVDDHAHDLLSDAKSPSSLGLDEPPADGIISEIPVLSPPGLEAETQNVSPRTGGNEFTPAPPIDLNPIPQQPTSPNSAMPNLLQRRFEQEMRSRNLSESLSPGTRFGGSASGGLAGPALGEEMGSRASPLRQSHSGALRSDSMSHLSPKTGSTNSSPQSSPHSPTQSGAPKLDSKRNSNRPGSISREGPAFRAPPPLRLVPAPATPSIAGPGHEGKYDWANFVFAYSRGKWDPHRLPRPPGQSTLHPGVKTRITQPNPYVLSTGPDTAGADMSAEGMSRGASDPARLHGGGGKGKEAVRGQGAAFPNAGGLVASPTVTMERLRMDDVPPSHGPSTGSSTLTAPEVSVSPATPIEAQDASDSNPLDAAVLAPRRPSLTYVADSPPAAAETAKTSAADGTPARSGMPASFPRKSVTAEEAAARVAAASHTAHLLLQEREMAERSEERAASGQACSGPAIEAARPGAGRHEQVLAVGGDADDSNPFPCATTFTSPFTSVAIRNMLESTKGTAPTAQAGAQTDLSRTGQEAAGAIPVPLSPAASAPADRGLPSEDGHGPFSGPSSLHQEPISDRRHMALNAALGLSAQRSNTYSGPEHKFDPLAYKRNSGAQTKKSSQDDADRTDLDRSTGFRDRPAGAVGASGSEFQTHSMPAQSQDRDMWESASIGLSNRSGAQPHPSRPEDVPDDQKVMETKPTPANPGGFQLDEESQRKVEKIAEEDFKEQLKQSSGVLPPVAQTVGVSTSPTELGNEQAQVPVPQRPGPTPVQASPTASSDAVGDRKKSSGGATAEAPQHTSSALSTKSGSGSSSGGSFHNPPLHRRRRPSPSTNKSTPPGSSAGHVSRSFQMPHGLASSASSPSASVRALGLGAVAVEPSSSRDSPEDGADTATMPEGMRPSTGDKRSTAVKGSSSALRSNSSPTVERFRHEPMDIAEGVEFNAGYVQGSALQIDGEPSSADSTTSELQQVKQGPASAEAVNTASPASEAEKKGSNTESMTRHASYSGSPTPRSPPTESAGSSTRGDSSSKKNRRPGSSGGLHRSIMGSPYMSVSTNNSGWGSAGLDSSTVAELRMAASRRKSLETHPPVLLHVGSTASLRDGQAVAASSSEEQSVVTPGSKVNLNVAKQSGAALSLSGKLPLSTVAQAKSANTAATAAASALGMLKLQLTHSLSYPPDKEVQELWAKQAEAGQDKDESKRKGKSSKGSTGSKGSGRPNHSESMLSYTIKQVATETDRDSVWQKSETVTAKSTERLHSRRSSEREPAPSEQPVRSQDFALANKSALSPLSPPGPPANTPSAPGALRAPGGASSAVASPAAQDASDEVTQSASAPLGSVSSSSEQPDWNMSTVSQCDLRSFSTARPTEDAAMLKARPNLIPSSSAAMNAYLTAGGRAEAFYIQNGYLPAIMPPNELERRQALKRYGPPKLAGNAHFDRIAHLVKLVFNTKLVLVSLVGENEQIFQTESGGGGSVTLQVLQRLAKSRDCSFCAHAILQDGDEPIVILDASRDWRFAGNPLVLGPPHIRFYAGSPLRTADGYNIGSLCIIDDRPWTEFSPRQRHTLKEFARVVMREMELLRDRIQLGLRDNMQRSIENFTRECVEMDLEETTPSIPKTDDAKSGDGTNSSGSGSGQVSTVGIHRVYDMAARAMKDALQVSGAIVFDLSHLELLDTITSADVDDPDGQHSIFFPGPLHNADFASTIHSPPTTTSRSRETSIHSEASAGLHPEAIRRSSDESVQYRIQQQQARLVPPMAVLGSSETLPPPETREDPVPLSHHVKVAEFLRVHRAGRYFPFIPLPFQHLLPAGMSNVLIVPVFGLNKQPFAMLCAYSQDHEAAPSLDELKESGLQYLRAIGMIVLSAVLKKDIVLADKAKSHFISNISHELRTPLHGILAAAELLAETKLNSTQGSYLETVEACGKSLLELVNHVLDFTKLSGNSRSHMARQNEKTRCDLVKLIQEVCESSWIGSIAKTLENKHSGIGSVYAPPQGPDTPGASTRKSIGGVAKMRETGVETVIDISMRDSGWLVQCDAGGIRRVLMNLIGNSLKFTNAGFVHVSLREIQSTDTHVVIELGVTDTGRGISRSFLEEQLFHPFTQENPLGTGTGLGLSIVNSIVQSPALNGKIDVWSTEGQGTEIRVTCELELSNINASEGVVYQPALRVQRQYTISLLSFGYTRGEEDLKEVVKSYLADWWGFDVLEPINPTLVPGELGDLVIINEDAAPLKQIAQRGGQLPPVIVLTSSRGDASIANACEAYHAAGGVARLLFKPAGPAKLESVLDFCLQCLERIRRGDPPDPQDTKPSTPLPSPSPSPRESPAWRPTLEQQKSYFGPTADPVTGTDIARRQMKAGATPTDDITPGSWNDLTPKPKGYASPSVIHKHSPHISPNPPEASSTLLIRRHSTESKVTHQSASEPSLLVPTGGPGYSVSGAGVVAAPPEGAPSSSSTKPSRPLLPARSITYHEPRLHKHVLMSPHPAIRRAEGQDYFGLVSSGPGGHTPTAERGGGGGGDAGSLPSSPGSTISLDGGEGAVLKTAVASAGSAAGSSSSASSKSGGKLKKQLRILSVEDNPINRRVIQAFLAKMGIEYVEATDGMQGVKAFAAHPPHYFDVILMDLSMPVLDGIGATAAIRRIELDRERAAATGTSSTGATTPQATSVAASSSEVTGTSSNKASPGSQSTASTSSSISASSAVATSVSAASAASGSASGGGAGSTGSSHVSATTAAAVAAAVSASGPPSRLPHPRTRVKIFALTGRSTDEDKRKAFATGADGYIVKPLSFKVLSSLLKMLAR